MPVHCATGQFCFSSSSSSSSPPSPPPPPPPLGREGDTHLLEKHGYRRDNDPLEHGPRLEQLLDGNELQLEDVPGCGFAQLGEQFGDGSLLE
jgi:hypothetical protein